MKQNTTTNTETNLTPPAFLNGRALEVWHELAPEIQSLNAAVQVESIALGALCAAVADLEAAEAAIAEHGLVHKTERGITKNPAVSIKSAALQHIHRFASSFGLTPASRPRTAFSRRLNSIKE